MDRLIAALSAGGQLLMEPAEYPFARKFARNYLSVRHVLAALLRRRLAGS